MKIHELKNHFLSIYLIGINFAVTNPMKTNSFLIILVSFVFAFGCKKESNSQNNDTKTTPVAPKDSITNLMVTFYNTEDSSNQVGGVSDPDGPGPIQASYNGVVLLPNTLYNVSIRLEDETGSFVNISDKIKANPKDYLICFGNNLSMSTVSTDSDGTHSIGLKFNLTTSSMTGSGNLDLNIKYQKGVKNGQCEPGSLYYSAYVPILIN